ncbi:Rieske (2Fe-2S) protein [Streptomyces sp. NPDC048179]|uniref:Rieske (2Fe-2S) protein n=1 Tax=Streptomyces sp. NPDC048179 TaxID=3365506 RepID=UPI00370F7809
MTDGSTRRTVLATGAAALAVGCAGCSNYNDNSGSSSSSESPSAESTTGAAAGTALAQTSEIPEGGGTVFKDQKVVVTQPTKGEFKAFSAICTHQGCTVNRVADGTIDCPCHGSKYKIADGSVAHGPATRPLPAKSITVSGNSITLA